MPEIKTQLDLTPGSVIEADDLRSLTVLEDQFAAFVAPNYDEALWAYRQPKLRDLVVPPHSIVPLRDIRLEVMTDSAERLLDARERGWKLPNVNMAAFTSENTRATLSACLGFTLSAVVTSSRQRDLGPLQAEAWYIPVTFDTNESQGTEVRTVATAPQYQANRLKAMHRSSVRFGAIAVSDRCTLIPKPRGSKED